MNGAPLFCHALKSFYSDQDYVKFKDRYLVLANDGTTYQLPYEEELIEVFNEFDNGQGQPICMARGFKVFDVLNQLNVWVTLAAYHNGKPKGSTEQELFEECLQKIPQLIDLQQHNVLLLGDRYYPSYYYLYELPRLGYDFVFRCSAGFCKEVKTFAQSDQSDQWLEIDLGISRRIYSTSAKRIEDKPAHIRVRCVKIALPNREMEYLLTNIESDTLSRQDLKELYAFRWNEETSFDTDKNKLEVENLSSKTLNGVLQDFHAKVLTANITQLLMSDAQHQLDQEQAPKQNKYDYQINRCVATGLVKDELPTLLSGQELVNSWYPRLLEKILRRREPVRPNRKFPRKRKHKLRFPINRRRAL